MTSICIFAHILLHLLILTFLIVASILVVSKPKRMPCIQNYYPPWNVQETLGGASYLIGWSLAGGVVLVNVTQDLMVHLFHRLGVVSICIEGGGTRSQ